MKRLASEPVSRGDEHCGGQGHLSRVTWRSEPLHPASILRLAAGRTVPVPRRHHHVGSCRRGCFGCRRRYCDRLTLWCWCLGFSTLGGKRRGTPRLRRRRTNVCVAAARPSRDAPHGAAVERYGCVRLEPVGLPGMRSWPTARFRILASTIFSLDAEGHSQPPQLHGLREPAGFSPVAPSGRRCHV